MRKATDPFHDFIEAFITAKNLAATSRRDYTRYLVEFDAATGHVSLEEALSLENAARWVEEVRPRGLAAAHNGALYLKSFASWIAKSKYIVIPGGGSLLHGLEAPKVAQSNRQAFTDSQLALISMCIENRKSSDRLRARAYLWLLFATGLRKNEARQLALADLHIDPVGNRSWVHVRATTSKGMKERRVRLDRRAVPFILAYINGDGSGCKKRETYVADDDRPEPLFLTQGGRAFSYHGFGTWADQIFKEIKKETGIKGSSHWFRHTWATMFHRASGLTGMTVYDLKWQGGWADLNIPMRYTHDRPWEELLDMPSHLSALAERDQKKRETS